MNINEYQTKAAKRENTVMKQMREKMDNISVTTAKADKGNTLAIFLRFADRASQYIYLSN